MTFFQQQLYLVFPVVCEVLSEELPTKVHLIEINDKFTKTGSASDLLRKYEVDAKGIYRKIKELIM